MIVVKAPPPKTIVIERAGEHKTAVIDKGVRVPVIDSLTSDNPQAALSARMGKVLNSTKLNDVDTDLLSLYHLAKGE